MTFRRLPALLCALALLLQSSALAYSYAMGEELRSTETNLHQEARLSKNVFWSTVYSDVRTEHFITYTPGGSVRPIVTYGSVLSETSALSTTAKALEQSGYRVIGGINGDFYNTSSGLPVGLIVTDGLLRSSDSGYYAMGFRKDGSAVLGQPRLSVSADLGYQVYGTRVVRNITAVNKLRESGGIYLFTYDCLASHTTGNA